MKQIPPCKKIRLAASFTRRDWIRRRICTLICHAALPEKPFCKKLRRLFTVACGLCAWKGSIRQTQRMRAALALFAVGSFLTHGAALEFFEQDGDVKLLADKKAVVSEVCVRITLRINTLEFHQQKSSSPKWFKKHLDSTCSLVTFFWFVCYLDRSLSRFSLRWLECSARTRKSARTVLASRRNSRKPLKTWW